MEGFLPADCYTEGVHAGPCRRTSTLVVGGLLPYSSASETETCPLLQRDIKGCGSPLRGKFPLMSEVRLAPFHLFAQFRAAAYVT
jgi:hypothetical protein